MHCQTSVVDRLDDGTVTGFWADLVREIAAQEEWEITWVWGSWQEGLDRLRRLLGRPVRAVGIRADQLEIHHLANPHQGLDFALLTDFLDSPTQDQEGDEELGSVFDDDEVAFWSEYAATPSKATTGFMPLSPRTSPPLKRHRMGVTPASMRTIPRGLAPSSTKPLL